MAFAPSSSAAPASGRLLRNGFMLVHFKRKKDESMEKQDVSLRKATVADIPALDELLLQVHRIHSDARSDLFTPGAKKYDDGELREILADSNRPVFVGELGGRVVGYAFCVIQETRGGSMRPRRTLYLDDLCVDRQVRGHHIGSRIYQFVREAAVALGCADVTLCAWADNPNAVAFYRHLGLRVRKYVFEDVI